MTVAELRRDLMKFDSNAEVMIDSQTNSYPLETFYDDANEYVYPDENFSKYASEAQANALVSLYLIKRVTSLVGRLGILIASLVMCYLTNSPRWVFVILLYLIF